MGTDKFTFRVISLIVLAALFCALLRPDAAFALRQAASGQGGQSSGFAEEFRQGLGREIVSEGVGSRFGEKGYGAVERPRVFR